MSFFASLASSVKSTLEKAKKEILEAKDELLAEKDVLIEREVESESVSTDLFQGSDAFRSAALRLSEDDRTFLVNAPPDFEFDLKDHLEDAKAAMKFDPKLSKIRYQLVPRYIKDALFWRNYFYQLLRLRAPSDGGPIAFPKRIPVGTAQTRQISGPAPPLPPRPSGSAASAGGATAAAAAGAATVAGPVRAVRAPTRVKAFGIHDDDTEFASDQAAAHVPDASQREAQRAQLGLADTAPAADRAAPADTADRPSAPAPGPVVSSGTEPAADSAPEAAIAPVAAAVTEPAAELSAWERDLQAELAHFESMMQSATGDFAADADGDAAEAAAADDFEKVSGTETAEPAE